MFIKLHFNLDSRNVVLKTTLSLLLRVRSPHSRFKVILIKAARESKDSYPNLNKGLCIRINGMDVHVLGKGSSQRDM